MSPALRIAALRRFAIAISVLTILGHTLLGFEPPWAAVLVALATTYGSELLLERVQAWSLGKAPRYRGGARTLIDFLLPAHISGLAVAMLLYANARPLPIVFAALTAIGSKFVLRAPVGRGTRHFMNPSNTGIAATLLLFPWVGITPPYQFTEHVAGAWDWIVPGIVVCTGSFLNARFTKRIPLILAWLLTFAAQALFRAGLFGTPTFAGLVPMTGMAYLLFTFYMVTDPATTPDSRRGQIAFGAAVALAYGTLMASHVVFGLFFALGAVCALRGAGLWVLSIRRARREETTAAAAAVVT